MSLPIDFPHMNLIDGDWVDGSTGEVVTVMNPASTSELASIKAAGTLDTRFAIVGAHRRFDDWAGRTVRDRGKLLRQWHDLVMRNLDGLAELLTLEHGKPVAESRAEILAGAAYIEWFAEQAKRPHGDTIPTDREGRHLATYREPVGVVGIITPWNFPAGMFLRKAGAALAAGCTVVAKPAAETPLSALALARLAQDAGLPRGTINMVVGPAELIGEELTTNPTVRKISFTGSTAVGKVLSAQSASTLKRLSLELGGNAPFIVFDDADLDLAVSHALLSKFRGAGQTCVAANRIFVQNGVYSSFVERFASRVAALKVGPGMDEEVEVGPVINRSAKNRLAALLDDAMKHGGRVVAGGKDPMLGGLFVTPTVVADATSKMRAAQEEIFGPLAFVYSFDTEEEVLAEANGTPYGLAAYVYTSEYKRIHRMSSKLAAGMVGVNEWLVASEAAPFGGVKQSGMGREGSAQGLDDYTDVKYVCTGSLG